MYIVTAYNEQTVLKRIMYFTAVTAYLHHVHSSRCLKVLTYVELITQGHFFCCDQDVICASNIKYNYVN